MISHNTGYLLKDLLIIGVVGKVIMSCYGYIFFSNLMVSIVMKSSSLWYIYLVSDSTLTPPPHICGGLLPSYCLRYDASNLVLMFE